MSSIFLKIKEMKWMFLGLFLVLLALATTWLKGGFNSILLDTDLGRDLYEMSNIRMHKVVWLGPRLSVGFPSSPVYYYLFYPVLLLSKWNANSLILANIFLALLGLGLMAILGWKKWGWYSLVMVGVIGLTPFWRNTAVHPGNGYTYVIWLFLSLVCLWWEMPIFVSSLLLGLAIAYHPAGFFCLLILVYEWWRRKHTVNTFLLIMVALLLPWTPIIVFELITKGFLLRSFISNSSHQFGSLHFSVSNLQQMAAMTGFRGIVAALFLIIVGYISKGRMRVWYCLSLLPFFIFSLSPLLPNHYLLGSLTLLFFISLIILSETKIGRLLVLLILVLYFFQTVIIAKTPASTRSIEKIERVVRVLTNSKRIGKDKKLAVVAILSNDTSVPQADDYRYFLRTKGYDVLDVNQYSQADLLLMFVEEPTFKWQKWSSWETEQFGSRKISFKTNIGNITIIGFGK